MSELRRLRELQRKYGKAGGRRAWRERRYGIVFDPLLEPLDPRVLRQPRPTDPKP